MLQTQNKKHKSVLLIDDDKITHFLLQELFCEKLNLLCADCGKKGMDIMNTCNNDVDLVFLDLLIPNESSFNIFHEIKKRNSDVPIVAVTAASITELKNKCIEEGFNEIISKPIDIHELKDTVNRYLNYELRN